MSAASEIIYSPEEIRRKIQIAEHPDGSTVSCFSDPTGDIRSTVYKPFPGAALVYKDVHIPQFITNWRYGPVRALAIEYCLEGRLECQVGDDCLYVAPGDIVFFRTDPNLRVLQYPGSHYHAVTLMIYPDEPSPVLDLHLGMAGFSADRLSETYLPDGRYYSVLSRTEMLSDLFRSIVHMPDSVIHMYYGIKILEALILLAAKIPGINENPAHRVPRHQAEMAKNVYAYVMEHPEERYSIDDLAEQFSISPTQLKKYFNIVYGIPMQKFIREQKMRAAAEILGTTDRKVTEVAQMFGYTNTSKFAAAFKGVMGEHPKQYSLHNNTVSEKELQKTSDRDG